MELDEAMGGHRFYQSLAADLHMVRALQDHADSVRPLRL